MGTLVHLTGSTVTIVVAAAVLSFCGAIAATQVIYLDLSSVDGRMITHKNCLGRDTSSGVKNSRVSAIMPKKSGSVGRQIVLFFFL